MLTDLSGFTLAPGEAVHITFVPMQAGTFSVSTLRSSSLLGMRGRIRIVDPEFAPANPEVAARAADLHLLGAEAKN